MVIYNTNQKKWKEVDNGEAISLILKDNENFYAFSEEQGEVSVIMNEGDATGWSSGIIHKMSKGYLTSVKSSEGNIYLASIPAYTKIKGYEIYIHAEPR
ncbi:hypothetical protein ACTHPF_05975 [Paenibacillus sp. SAF-054]|uniref:hypothetical protein n=1 Tax=unclassified Paenibacillus TaxID=185978 RepID=UPI003F806172